MHPCEYAKRHPDKPAVIMAASGETVTYAQLDARSNQAAHMYRRFGCETGDAVAILLRRRFERRW